MKKEIDLDYEFWRQCVFELSQADELFEVYCKKKYFTDREKKELKKMLDEQWMALNEIYPHPNPHLRDAFKKNFGKL